MKIDTENIYTFQIHQTNGTQSNLECTIRLQQKKRWIKK